jgi:putative ABC transport system ATP-binding protein
MSISWHNFFFAAFDPAGTISLPGWSGSLITAWRCTSAPAPARRAACGSQPITADARRASERRGRKGALTAHGSHDRVSDTVGFGTNVVEARELVRRYGQGATEVVALRGVSLDVVSGQLVAVMGPSGSGKSTLMHTLAGLDQPTSGTVAIAGTEITGLDDTKLTLLRREHIGFVFQFFNLLPMLTAEENVLLPLSIADERVDREWLEDLLAKTGLTDRRSHRPAEMSGGQQQRVAIARALVTKPTILFADEPTGNLDSKTGGEILDLLRDSSQSYGQTIVMVTHDARAASIADRILFIADGQIVKELTDTSPADVLAVMSTLQS